uniref:Uncharacterized protein n=1 Tax=Jakoba bahamiensis TaxID=221721 RepID=M4QD66_9EUKA|nr:hypothetical protein L038_mgp41 [Jakoba bahamiensis]AGH24130.1 hypothetical protein [Jakoba bahamiensis]
MAYFIFIEEILNLYTYKCICFGFKIRGIVLSKANSRDILYNDDSVFNIG